MNTDFELAALYAALDARRQELGLTWTQAAREIGSGPISIRRVATSTIKTLRTKKIGEADGVLSMLYWLGRSPESFMRGFSPRRGESYDLPDRAPHQVLRFDTAKIHRHLNERRQALELTWKEVESETGVAASQMTGLAKGGRTSFPLVMRLTSWLGQPAANFVRLARY